MSGLSYAVAPSPPAPAARSASHPGNSDLRGCVDSSAPGAVLAVAAGFTINPANRARVAAAGPDRRFRRRCRGEGLAHRGGAAARSHRGDRRRARRGRLVPGHPARRLLAVPAGGRPARRGGDRGPGVVRAGRDLLRHPGPRPPAGRDPGHRGRPRQHRQRRPRRHRHRHLPRPPPGLLLRREPAGRPERRRPERGRRAGQQPHSRQHRPQSRFHLGLEGADHRPGLRGRDPDPVQEPPLPRRPAAELGLQRDAGGPADRLHRHLDRRPAREREFPGAGRRHRRAARSQARGGGRGPAVRDRHRRRQPRRRRRRIHPRRRESRCRPQPPARLHQLLPRRHDQSRLQPGRERRGTGDGERAVRALLSGEAAVLPRGHRAVRLAADAGLHPAHRESQGRRQARRASSGSSASPT